MLYIESHTRIAHHPKTKSLARMLKINKAQAIGHLHLLWWWTLDFAPTGELSAFTSCNIAEAAEWTGDADLFIRAMVECGKPKSGWMDENPLRIHDWHDIAGKLLDKREKDAERKRVQRTSNGRPTDGAGRVEQSRAEQRKEEKEAHERKSNFLENGHLEEKPPQTPLVSKEVEKAGNGSPQPVKIEPCPGSGETAGMPKPFPEAIYRAAQPVLGLTCDLTLLDWLSRWPENRILSALATAERKKLAGKRAADYCEAILRNNPAEDTEPAQKPSVAPKPRRKPTHAELFGTDEDAKRAGDR